MLTKSVATWGKRWSQINLGQSCKEKCEDKRVGHLKETDGEDVGEVVVKLFREKFTEGVKPKHCYRVSRFGGNNGANKTWRPIVVTFNSFEDKLKITKKKKSLQGTSIFINDDMTPADLALRKELLPVIDEAREKNRKWHFKDGQLFIDGKRHWGA